MSTQIFGPRGRCLLAPRRARVFTVIDAHATLSKPQSKAQFPHGRVQSAFLMKGMTNGAFPKHRKPVLSNINLQFYQGAKIGIVGPNGAGKSTLMKIMAGIDTDYFGRSLAG